MWLNILAATTLRAFVENNVIVLQKIFWVMQALAFSLNTNQTNS